MDAKITCTQCGHRSDNLAEAWSHLEAQHAPAENDTDPRRVESTGADAVSDESPGYS